MANNFEEQLKRAQELRKLREELGAPTQAEREESRRALEREQDIKSYGEIADLVSQGLIKYGAARKGLQEGVDLSKLQEGPKADWRAAQKEARERYLTREAEFAGREKEAREMEAMTRPVEEKFEIPKEAEQLRREWSKHPTTQDTDKMIVSYQKVKGASDNAAGDVSLIFGYMKMLDPGSVVREGEFATAENTAGIPERIRVMYNKAIAGDRLSPNQRNNFKGESAKVLNAQLRRQKTINKRYENLSDRYKVDPRLVVDPEGMQLVGQVQVQQDSGKSPAKQEQIRKDQPKKGAPKKEEEKDFLEEVKSGLKSFFGVQK